MTRAITLRGVPVAELVYSVLAFHGPGQRGELPGRWLVAALEGAGVAPAAVRQAVFRLEREGHVASRRSGRAKWYRLTASGLAQVAAGRDRLFPVAARRPWDGAWTIVAHAFDGQRREREQFLAVLAARGYGRTRTGLHIHPHDAPASVHKIARQLDIQPALEIYRGRIHGKREEVALVQSAFSLRRIATSYRRFLQQFAPFEHAPPTNPRDAFTLRLMVAQDFLNAAWDDPGLAAPFLPAKWPGGAAHRLAQQLYRRAAPGAHRFAAEVAQRLSLPWKDMQ